MGSGGELPDQRRQFKTSERGGEPILFTPRNTTSEDMAPAVKTDGFLGDDGEPPRYNTSAIRLAAQPTARSRTTGSHQPASAIPPRRQQTQTRNVPARPAPRPAPAPQKRPPRHSPFQVHWLLPIGVAMVVMVILWLVGSAALSWGKQRLDDIQYGNPRTYQTDMVVGHSDSTKNPSHFIAMNLHSQIIVIEFMGGNPQKAITYLTPVFITGANGDLAPVTLEFRDVNGDAKPDMLVHIHLASQDQVSVFINDGQKFRPSNGSDKITL